MVMGEVGNNNTDMAIVLGKYGCGTINDNGDRLVEVCAVYNLVVLRSNTLSTSNYT